MIVQPAAYECLDVRVSDDPGNVLPTAGMFVCPLAPDGTPCAGPSFDGPDPDGVIRLDLDPMVMYRMNAFIATSGWPCPAYVSPSGQTFHFSPTQDLLGADLAGTTTTFVIHHPDSTECPHA